MKKVIIMISGRGSNMLAIARNVLEGKLKDLCQIQAVFSNDENAMGLETAKALGIRTQSINSKGKKRSTYNGLLLEWLKKENPDLIVLAGYMRIVPVDIIQAFPHRIINIHPADTSQHQGLQGYDWAWENKLASTKVTVHYVDEGLDTGSVIGKREVDLKGAESLEEIEKRGLTVEHKFYSECLKMVFEKD